MSKIKNGGLDQYGVGVVEQQHFGTAGVEGVKASESYSPNRTDRQTDLAENIITPHS